jgi:hypothetical protein
VVGEYEPGGFFVQTDNPTSMDYLYFSLVTLATLGYGDLTASGSLGRMLSVTEALAGQLYLVSIVAVLVSNLGRERRSTPVERGDGPRPADNGPPSEGAAGSTNSTGAYGLAGRSNPLAERDGDLDRRSAGGAYDPQP